MPPLAKIRCKKASPGRLDAFGKLLINYSLERPFEDWPKSELLNCFESALSQPEMNLEISTLVINEIKSRGENVEDLRGRLLEVGASEIDWLKGARHRVLNLVNRFKTQKPKAKNCKVYFVLLTEDRETPCPWGLYVGETFEKIENRFSIHLTENSKLKSRHVYRRGWQVLYSLSNLVPTMAREDCQRFEGIALGSFRGYLVHKCIKRLPKSRIEGGGPEKFRVLKPA
jgi:hypothetical protein